MRSASSYINRRRVSAEASITKVQYPHHIAVQNTLLSSENCSRDFSTISYIYKICCQVPKKPNPIVKNNPTLSLVENIEVPIENIEVPIENTTKVPVQNTVLLIEYPVRKHTSEVWVLFNPILLEGEPGYDIDNGILKVGDGITPWNSLKNIGPGQTLLDTVSFL